jgi:hypothetical protein
LTDFFQWKYFRQTDSFGEKSGKTMQVRCGCRASGFSPSTGHEQLGRDKNPAQVLRDFVRWASAGTVRKGQCGKEAFGLT